MDNAQLICQGLTYLPIWTAFVAFPICRHHGKKLSMMAFVKCDKSKATVVFQRKRQKVQLQNTVSRRK